jgi:hypothetical protein
MITNMILLMVRTIDIWTKQAGFSADLIYLCFITNMIY